MLPPLYPGIEWEATKSGKFTFNSQMTSIENADGFVNEAFGLKDFPYDLFSYYFRELAAQGWTQTMVAQGAPNGQLIEYEKNGYYINIEAQEFEPIPTDDQGMRKDTPIILRQYRARVEYN
jgi:hypothetical protein